MSQKRILIVGGGFAGVHAAVGATATLRAAGDTATAVALISPGPDLVIRPRLYEADLAGVCVPLRGVLEPIGVTHRQASVVEIDARRRQVRTDDRAEAVSYDQLVFAAGSRLQAPAGTHTIDDLAGAQALQRTLAGLARAPRVIVVGGGFTGLEAAAELAGTLRARGGRVTLVDRDPDVAPAFGARARRVIADALRELQVETRTGRAVLRADARGVTLADGERLDADLVVWAGGPRASALAEQLPAPRDALGRLEVDAHLATRAAGIWAAGDSAAARADGRHGALMSCQHAVPQGRRAGENAAAAILGRSPGRYRQPLYLTCLDLGRAGAVITAGFGRDTVLATGQEGKLFKRYINRSLIYPPPGASAERLLALGTPTATSPPAAALAGFALRSAAIRRRVTGGAPDHAAAYAESAAGGLPAAA